MCGTGHDLVYGKLVTVKAAMEGRNESDAITLADWNDTTLLYIVMRKHKHQLSTIIFRPEA